MSEKNGSGHATLDDAKEELAQIFFQCARYERPSLDWKQALDDYTAKLVAASETATSGMPTHDEIAAYRDLFRRELDKNMNNSSGSPSTEAHEIALRAFVEGRNKGAKPSATRRTELGCAGHLIVANRCRWKRHTQVGNYRVSTIGDYYPDGENGKRDTIGAGKDSLFETMVFQTTDEQDKENEGCGCHAVKDWSEIECERYATAGAAQAGHERYVSKYQEAK